MMPETPLFVEVRLPATGDQFIEATALLDSMCPGGLNTAIVTAPAWDTLRISEKKEEPAGGWRDGDDLLDAEKVIDLLNFTEGVGFCSTWPDWTETGIKARLFVQDPRLTGAEGENDMATVNVVIRDALRELLDVFEERANGA